MLETKVFIDSGGSKLLIVPQPQARAGCVLAGRGQERWALLAFPLLDDEDSPRLGDDAAALLMFSPLDRADVSTLKGILTEFFGLTDAEERVALQIAGGQGAAEIAQMLELSIPTVRTHLSHIYHKTEPGSIRRADSHRLTLVGSALRLGHSGKDGHLSRAVRNIPLISSSRIGPSVQHNRARSVSCASEETGPSASRMRPNSSRTYLENGGHSALMNLICRCRISARRSGSV